MHSNRAMVRIMESCGMTLDCVRANHYLINDAPQDLLYYSIPGCWTSTQQHFSTTSNQSQETNR